MLSNGKAWNSIAMNRHRDSIALPIWPICEIMAFQPGVFSSHNSFPKHLQSSTSWISPKELLDKNLMSLVIQKGKVAVWITNWKVHLLYFFCITFRLGDCQWDSLQMRLWELWVP